MLVPLESGATCPLHVRVWVGEVVVATRRVFGDATGGMPVCSIVVGLLGGYLHVTISLIIVWVV